MSIKQILSLDNCQSITYIDYDNIEYTMLLVNKNIVSTSTLIKYCDERIEYKGEYYIIKRIEELKDNNIVVITKDI